MAELKTKVNDASVGDFLNSVKEEQKRHDSFALLEIFQDITGETPKMWGSAIVGFGKIHYKSSRSSQEGDWPIVAFSPRVQALTLYVLCRFESKEDLLKKLGKHKIGKGCLYIKRLSDVDLVVLKKIIKDSYDFTKKNGLMY